MGVVEWRAVRQASGEIDTDLYDVTPVRLAFNRWASSITARFEDVDGTKQSLYPRGQRVEFEVQEADDDVGGTYGGATFGGGTYGGETWGPRAAGIVQNTTRKTAAGVPTLEVDLVSYDHLLRRREIFKTYTSTAKSAILEDLITNFTSVNWVASNVSVQNDTAITREFKGTRVDEAISEIAGASADEEFGVTIDLEFFFEQRNTTTAPALGDADIVDYDLPRTGKQAVNQFRLFYGEAGSESSVLVEDREEQRDLRDKLGAPRRVVIADSDTIPEIGTEDRAKDVAQQRLNDRSELQTGTVTTFRRFDTDPGDVISLTISDADIQNEDFRVAQVDHTWVDGRTTLTVAENAPNIDDLLVGLSDSLSNVRARDADPDAAFTRFLAFESGLTLSLSATIRQKTQVDHTFTAGFGASGSQASVEPVDTVGFNYDSYSNVSVSESIATAASLNMLRDVWQGESATDITHLAVGSGSDSPTVADGTLSAERTRVSIGAVRDQTTASVVQFEGALQPRDAAAYGTLQEVGAVDAATSGSLYLRLTHGQLTHDGETTTSYYVELTLDDDADAQGVVTSTGQERLRDLYIGETGHEPTDMAYGTGTTDAAESDTGLETKVGETAIDSFADRSTGETDVVDRLGTAELNGNDLSEIGEENASDELLTRLVFEALGKTSDFALETNHRLKVRNR